MTQWSPGRCPTTCTRRRPSLMAVDLAAYSHWFLAGAVAVGLATAADITVEAVNGSSATTASQVAAPFEPAPASRPTPPAASWIVTPRALEPATPTRPETSSTRRGHGPRAPHPHLPAPIKHQRKPQPEPQRTPQKVSGVPKVRMAHANIYAGLSPAGFAADLRTVVALKPDFVTLNEAVRPYDLITPDGYESYRSNESRPTLETPVLWRTDRWEKTAAGTRYLSLRQVKWGIRAVNWVTLRNRATGKTLSVVSAHPAPTIKATQGLLPAYMAGLGTLVHELAPAGPILVGGDFNMGYHGPLWTGPALAEAGLAPTYDVLGKPAGGTGDHGGSTIDYLFFQPDSGLTPVRDGTVELRSDHDAVWADFRLP